MVKSRWAYLAAAAAVAMALSLPAIAIVSTAPGASATSCSTSSGNSSCTIATSVTVTGGTLSLESSSNLYWGFVLNGYDQWASASATSLSCTGSTSGTTCTGGTAPVLEVIDASGSGSGWSLSEYLTNASGLPSGAVLHFDGIGSTTIGHSQNGPVATDPFSSTTPGTVCDYGSTCTVTTAATTCSHAALGYSTCPTYPVNVAAGTSSTSQVDLYSAKASSGLGAICFGSGTATAAGCTGTTPDDYYNVGLPANTSASTYTTAVVNLTVSSGP